MHLLEGGKHHGIRRKHVALILVEKELFYYRLETSVELISLDLLSNRLASLKVDAMMS